MISPPWIETTRHRRLLYACEQEKNWRYWYSGEEAFIAHGTRDVVKAMRVSSPASVRVCYDHNKALVSELVLADFHPGQKGRP